MKTALYVGDHAGDTALVKFGCYMTRKVQKGIYSTVTHVEAIHEEHSDGTVTIASSSLREGGVRSKRVALDRDNWWIVNVPIWDVDLSIDLLFETEGMQYDWRGAAATVFIGNHNSDSWFCNEWCGYPYLKESSRFTPSQYAAIAFSLGRDITDSFFKDRLVG